MDIGALPSPLAIIDFEASALTMESYPIEVGVAIYRAGDGVIETWSTLIAPHPQWKLDDQWDRDAERVHGIRRWDLRTGMSPADAIDALHHRLGAVAVIYCDDSQYDGYWLATLAKAASMQPRFALADLRQLVGDDVHMSCLRKTLAKTTAEHRAGADAERICAALLAISADQNKKATP